MPSKKNTPMSRFMLVSVIVGQWGILVGVGITIIGVVIAPWSGVASTILTTVGTATFTAALVGIIYESFQKEVFTGDLTGMFKISSSLSQSGILDIAEPKADTMNRYFNQRKLVIIPISPFAWYTSHKLALYKAACARGTNIEMWVPEYDDPAVGDILSRQAQVTSTELAQEMRKFMRDVEEDWNKAAVHPDSELSVKSYKDVPHLGVYFGENNAILEYQTASPASPTVYGHTWIEVRSEGGFYEWSSSEAARITQGPGSGTLLVRPSYNQSHSSNAFSTTDVKK